MSLKERNTKNYIKYLKDYGFNVKCEKWIYLLGDINEAKVIDKEAIREIQILTIVGANDGILNRKCLVECNRGDW